MRCDIKLFSVICLKRLNYKILDFTLHSISASHPAKTDLNKKWLPKQKTIQNFNVYAQGFRKTRNENPPTQEIGVTS